MTKHKLQKYAIMIFLLINDPQQPRITQPGEEIYDLRFSIFDGRKRKSNVDNRQSTIRSGRYSRTLVARQRKQKAQTRFE